MEEVIRRANDTSYGLASGILTNDINKILTFSQAIQAGTVWYVSLLLISIILMTALFTDTRHRWHGQRKADVRPRDNIIGAEIVDSNLSFPWTVWQPFCVVKETSWPVRGF